jgi:ubiquinone/menaquinone biosynthesis C-methylase UbiE
MIDALVRRVTEALIKSKKALNKIIGRLLVHMLIRSDRGLEKLLNRLFASDEALSDISRSIVALDNVYALFTDRFMDRMVQSDLVLDRTVNAMVGNDKIFDHLMQSFDSSKDERERVESLLYDLRKNPVTREAWLERALLDIPAGGRILDAGAGEQQYKKFCAHLHYVSQDFAKYDGVGDNTALQIGKWDQKGLDIVSDITSIPEPDASFDAIMCIEVFEHLPNPIMAIQEFARLLKPEGALIITAPFCSMTHFAPYHFSTGFNHYYYKLYLEQYGFKIKEILANGNYFDYIGQEIRRISYVASRYTKVKADSKEILAMSILIKMLERCSQGDCGSSELLNFGYHVQAVKLPN